MAIPWVNWGWKPRQKLRVDETPVDFSSRISDFYKAQDEYQKCLTSLEESLSYEQTEKYYAVKNAATKLMIAQERMKIISKEESEIIIEL